MYIQNGVAVYPSEEARSLPHLDELLGSYFHQDSSIFGDTLEAVIAAYRADTPAAEQTAALHEIRSFLATHGPDDSNIAAALEAAFHPETVIEAWDGLNASQWLERIASLLVPAA